MDTFNIIISAFFIGCIDLEAYLNAKDNLDHYDKNESRVNIIIAFIGVLVNLSVKGMMLSIFLWASSYSYFDLGNSIQTWVALFLLNDLQFYLFHVLGHKSRFFWAMHVIHHSSTKYNLTTAIRTPFTNSIFRFTSLLPLVLIGFDPLMVVWMDSLIISFTFFQHTEMIKKLGWAEYIFSTPSHHRVHHASDAKYLDKNYGGVLIIWDKLFGTFQVEEESPTYGLTKPINSTNVFTILFHEWRDIIRDLSKTKNWKYRINYLFAKPGWKPTPVKFNNNGSMDFTLFFRRIVLIIVLIGITFSMTSANSSEEWVKRGILAEKKFDEQNALKFYELAIKENPNHVEALWRASRMLSNSAGRSADKNGKLVKAKQADALAKKAIRLNPQSVEARLCHIIALGLLSEVASSPSEKLTNAKVIYAEAETVLTIDSLNAPAYYVLGKWHLELAKLNWAEKLACNLLFGGVPRGVSFDKSLRYFEKAIRLQPDYILFYYGKASVFYHTGSYDKAITILERALHLTPVEPDDAIRQQKCKSMLKESKQLYAKI